MKGWYNLTTYLGYDSNKSIKVDGEKSNISSSNSPQLESKHDAGGYGGLTSDDGVNPFQAAMAKNKQENSNENLLGGTSVTDGWETTEWEGETSNNWDNDWEKETSPVKVKAKGGLKKQDSWGNNTDEWEAWLNDDSGTVTNSDSKGGKKGD